MRKSNKITLYLKVLLLSYVFLSTPVFSMDDTAQDQALQQKLEELTKEIKVLETKFDTLNF